MFNISIRKVGGIQFIKIGRINISFSVSSPEKYRNKLEERVEKEAMKALKLILA